jgi:UDP-N-acetylglucosamine 3-dehydrogenase
MRVAIIGFGVMGRIHYRILRAMSGVEVAAVCDPAARPPSETKWYAEPAAMLAAERPDTAVIAVPTPLHHDITLACVKRGVHVFVEKPVAASAAEARRMIRAVAKARVKSAVGHVERFNPVVQALRRELAGRKILSISFTRVGHMPPRISGVGVLTDLAVHDIDLLGFITGRRIRRSSVYASRAIRNHHEDSANLSFELEGGVLATITTNWLTPFKRRKIEVTTAHGYFEADLIAQELREYSAYKDDGTYLTRPCAVRKGEPLAGELRALAAYLGSGKRGDLASFEDSLFTLEVIERGAAGTGRAKAGRR